MNPLDLLKLAPWILSAVLALGGFTAYEIERGNYQECKAARAEDATAAEKAKSAALDAARIKSDAIITEQAERFAETQSKAQTVTERIIRVPVTKGCGPAVHDALGSLPDLIPAGGGKAPAGSSVAPVVR